MTVIVGAITVIVGTQLQQDQAPDDAAAATCNLDQSYAPSACNPSSCGSGQRVEYTCECPANSFRDTSTRCQLGYGDESYVDPVLVGRCVTSSACSSTGGDTGGGDTGGGTSDTCTYPSYRACSPTSQGYRRQQSCSPQGMWDQCVVIDSCGDGSVQTYAGEQCEGSRTRTCTTTEGATGTQTCNANTCRYAACVADSGAVSSSASTESQQAIADTSSSSPTVAEALPATGFFDEDGSALLFGMALIILGLIVNRLGILFGTQKLAD